MRNRYEKFRIFNGLNESQINLFEEKISIIKHSKNDVIFNEGEKGETLFLLLEGEVEITQALTLELSKANFDTREKSILNLKSDEYPIFGEMSIFGTKELRTATVKAISDCKMGEISKFDLLLFSFIQYIFLGIRPLLFSWGLNLFINRCSTINEMSSLGRFMTFKLFEEFTILFDL